MCSLACVCGGGGGKGWSKKLYTGRLRREVQPLTLLWTIFDRVTEKVPLLYTFYHTQFRTLHPFQLLWIKCTFFKKKKITKWESEFLEFFSAIKWMLAFLSLFTNQNDRFPYFFISEIPTLSQIHIAEVRKSYPFPSDLLVYIIIRSTPTGMHYT